MSQLLSAWVNPSAASVAAWDVVYGLPAGVALGSRPATGMTVGAALAGLEATVSPLPMVRWVDRLLLTTRPVIKSIRLIGRRFPLVTQNIKRFLPPRAYWPGGYIMAVHMQAGAAQGYGALSWPEQVAYLARHEFLRDSRDHVYSADAAHDFVQLMAERNLINGVPVQWDMTAIKADSTAAVGISKLRAVYSMRRSDWVTASKVRSVALEQSGALALEDGARFAKYQIDSSLLTQWQAAALAQRQAAGLPIGQP